jgi:hypothetical protein
MSEIRKLWSKKNAVVFVWPGEEPLELQYDGLRIVVPPRDVIARRGVGSIYTHEAAEIGGRAVPGTAVIEDVTTVTPEGGYKTVLSIDNLCRYLTRDRDDLFGRGFNIVESTDQIQEAVTLGIPLYGESQIKRAREVLSREMQRQKGYKDRGETPPPSTSEKLIAWAVNHLKSVGPQKQAHKLEDLAAVMEGRAEAPAHQAPAAARPDADVMARAGAVFQAAASAGIRLNGIEMGNLLRGHEDTIVQVETRILAKASNDTRKQAEAVAASA